MVQVELVLPSKLSNIMWQHMDSARLSPQRAPISLESGGDFTWDLGTCRKCALELKLQTAVAAIAPKDPGLFLERLCALPPLGKSPSLQDARCRRLLKTNRERQQASCQCEVNLRT